MLFGIWMVAGVYFCLICLGVLLLWVLILSLIFNCICLWVFGVYRMLLIVLIDWFFMILGFCLIVYFEFVFGFVCCNLSYWFCGFFIWCFGILLMLYVAFLLVWWNCVFTVYYVVVIVDGGCLGFWFVIYLRWLSGFEVWFCGISVWFGLLVWVCLRGCLGYVSWHVVMTVVFVAFICLRLFVGCVIECFVCVLDCLRVWLLWWLFDW